MVKYYEASGKFDVQAILYFLLISIIALPILGLAYAYCIWYIPFIYINFIIAGVLGFVIAWLVRKFVVKLGKVRNAKLTLIFGFLAGLICMYFHWAVWVDLVINVGESYGNSRIGVTVSNIEILQVFNLAADPGILFDLIGEINKYGTWGIRSATVSGVFLPSRVRKFPTSKTRRHFFLLSLRYIRAGIVIFLYCTMHTGIRPAKTRGNTGRLKKSKSPPKAKFLG